MMDLRSNTKTELIHVPSNDITETERWINPANIAEVRFFPGDENETDRVVIHFVKSDSYDGKINLFDLQARQFKEMLRNFVKYSTEI